MKGYCYAVLSAKNDSEKSKRLAAFLKLFDDYIKANKERSCDAAFLMLKRLLNNSNGEEEKVLLLKKMLQIDPVFVTNKNKLF